MVGESRGRRRYPGVLVLGAVILGGLAVGACESSVLGGGAGGGDGGAGGRRGATGVTSTGNPTTSDTATSTGDVTTSGDPTTTSGDGGANALGACVEGSETSVSGTGAGASECRYHYDCTAGAVYVACTSTSDGGTCSCYLDDVLRGTCETDSYASCFFPDSCCHAVLGGDTTPLPGPYGDCSDPGTSVVTSSGPGGQDLSCSHSFQCRAGMITVSCSGTEGPAGTATCECRDPAGLVLGTCEQQGVDCDYDGSCCYDVLNR